MPFTDYDTLHTALDTAAPDSERWQAGLDAFEQSPLKRLGFTQKALEDALDAAAPDKEQWVAGFEVLQEAGLVSDQTLLHRASRGPWKIVLGGAVGFVLWLMLAPAANNLWASSSLRGFSTLGVIGLLLGLIAIGVAVALFISRRHETREELHNEL